MTPREQRKQRKEWRSRYHSSQKIKKAASSSVQPSPSTASGVSRQKLSALQKKADENALLKEQLAALHRQLSASQTRVKTLEKRAERSAKKPPTTPRSKTKALLQAENFKVTKASKVRKTLEFHHALVNEIQSSETADGSKHKFLSSLLAGEVLRKYRLLSRLRREANVRGQRKRSYRRRGTVSTRLANAVHEFYVKESVSKICPGKKDTITRYKEKKQRRVLTDTLSNLHRKFLSGHRYVSFTTFWRLKPLWVLPPRDSDRQTCLCKVCENFKLLSKVLHKDGFLPTQQTNTILSSVTCDVTSMDCMQGTCKQCSRKQVAPQKHVDGQVRYMQWDTVKEQGQFKDGNVKVVSFVDKKEHTDSAQNVWITFHQQLKVFKQHIFYVTSQYAFYTKVRDNIQSQEAVIHVDFSENYECKWESAIQSAHYGASKKHISLHTGFFQVSKEKVSSFCGVSDTLDHEPFAIWTYLLPILDKIKMCHPSVKKLYFFSDGPTAQYRQKINFYLLAHFVHVKGFDYCF